MVYTASCVVINCENTSRNSDCKFYRFPTTLWKQEQRNKWIIAVRRINPDGSLWHPKPDDRICSAHFISGRKADEQASPSYVPRIFPPEYKSRRIDENAAISRFQRYMERRNAKKIEAVSASASNTSEFELLENSVSVSLKIDSECQVDLYPDGQNPGKTFTCNRYIFYGKETCDADVQTEIDISTKIMKDFKITKHRGCNTAKSISVDRATITDNKYFAGFQSIKTDEQLLDLAGVTLNNFYFLLKTTQKNHKYMVSEKDRLLLFLMKMKLGVTFSALSVLFGIHRTTVSRIFCSYVEEIAAATSNLVFWPNKNAVEQTMPECFRPEYSNTRVIIDCIEFPIEVPSSVDNRVLCYSHYKKGFTAKVLIGITPGGFISFKSKVSGGRKSDSQITVESGLVDYLENGDIVLADKGFPAIKKVIDESGKEIAIIMPPFLKNKSEFTREETDATYKIARVRIHVERIMQRLKIYQILHKIPENLFYHIDDILHVCCVLVNLQPPIFSNK
ncbi:uncharacterized protein LOC134740463 [Cydia strobilella]|uniref:uncharacterized protein LOC134740463 n=1 Tax=Cydia strobilella TaxID=1100964 RepID=UPI0030053660